MSSRRSRLLGLMVALALVLSAALLPAAERAGAQDATAWLAKYRPALLPAFQDDMLAYLDAPRYAIDLTIAFEDGVPRLSGTQTVTYTNRLAQVALDEIVFRLYPNLPTYGADMRVSGVTVDGEPVTPRLAGLNSVLSVPLPQPLAPGASVPLSMDYTIRLLFGALPLYAQFGYMEGILALPNAYPVLSVYQPGEGWWDVAAHTQGDAVFSETAFYNVAVTAPQDMLFAASGSQIDLEANGDGTLTHRFVAPLMRDFALVGSTEYVTLSGEQDGVAIHVTYTPTISNAQQGAERALRLAQEAVSIFNRVFGPYPYSELDLVETPTRAGGIEYPGLIVLARHIWERGGMDLSFVTVHEVAHQWWYSLVGNDQMLDPWMDEALAQFATAVFIRETEGAVEYAQAIDSFRGQYERYAETRPEQPIGQPTVEYPDNAYFYFVYQKGPVFFATLAEEFGYAATLAMLRDYFDAYRYEIARPADMLRSFERSLGAELDPYFAEWVGAFPVG